MIRIINTYELCYTSSHQLVKFSMVENKKGKINLVFDSPKAAVYKRISFDKDALCDLFNEKRNYINSIVTRSKNAITSSFADDTFDTFRKLMIKAKLIKEV